MSHRYDLSPPSAFFSQRTLFLGEETPWLPHTWCYEAWSLILPVGPQGPGRSPEGHSGVPAGGRDPAGGQGDHRPGRGAAAGGGQPAVRLRLAGDAQPRHQEGTSVTQGGWETHEGRSAVKVKMTIVAAGAPLGSAVEGVGGTGAGKRPNWPQLISFSNVWAQKLFIAMYIYIYMECVTAGGAIGNDIKNNKHSAIIKYINLRMR